MAGSMPRPPFATHGSSARRWVQTDVGRGCLLARRQRAGDVTTDLRRCLFEQRIAAQASQHARRGRQTRSPQIGPRDEPLSHARRGPWPSLLASQWVENLHHPPRLHAPPANPRRLCRGEHAPSCGSQAMGGLWALGKIPREYVHCRS